MTEPFEGMLLAGRYRIGPVLGSGGMSIVRDAEDLRMSRRIALKFIKHPQSPELVERLFREARAAARANHPCVITVFDYGTDETTGLDYLAMEKLEGEDLARRISRLGPLSRSEVLRLGSEISDALAHVHDAGVVHRDLKPANVFLTGRARRGDEIKLLDFGLAKQLDLQSLTVTGQVLGSAAYMAPEQIVDSKRVDPRSDVYALGVLLFECATGRLPHRVQTVEDLARRVLVDDAPALQSGELGESLRAIILSCLKRNPAERFTNARALCDALTAAPHE